MDAEARRAVRPLRGLDRWQVGLALGTVAGLAVAATAEHGSLLFLLIAAATVAAAILTLRRPLAGVLTFVAISTLLPFAVFPARVVFAPTLVDLALTCTLLAWSLAALHRRARLVMPPVGGLVLLFMGLAVVSLTLGTGHSAVSSETLRLFLKMLNSILLFFTVIQVVRTVGELDVVIQGLVVGGGLAAAMALGLYALPRDTAAEALSALGPLGYPTGPAVIRTVAETEVVRATGTSIDPNVLGGLLMLAIALGVAQLLTPQATLPRLLGLVLVVAMVGGIALSYSRSSWLGVVAGVVFLAAFKDRRLWLPLGAAAVALALVPQGQVMLERLISGFQARDPAAAMRLGEYANALALIQEYPFFGIGFGDAPNIGVGIGVSNVYLLIGEEMGLVGLATFLAIVLCVWVQSLVPSAHATRDRAWAAHTGLQAALVASVVAGVFDHYFFNIRFPHMVALFWLLVGLLVVSTHLRSRAASASPPD